MWAHWAIVGRVAEATPDVMLHDGCPLCFARDRHAEVCDGPPCIITPQWFEDWIPSVADAALGRLEQLLAAETAGLPHA